jgi:hypothetical protein
MINVRHFRVWDDLQGWIALAELNPGLRDLAVVEGGGELVEPFAHVFQRCRHIALASE